MATYEKRPSGWLAKVRKGGVNRSSLFSTKAAATAWATAIEAEIQAHKAGQLPNKTFGQLLERYRDEEAQKKRGSRWEVVRINLFLRDSLLPHIRVADMQPRHFSEWRDRRLNGTDMQRAVSAASVLREMTLLSHACNVAAKEWGWLHTNPLHSVSKPLSPKARTRRISDKEIKDLLYACGYEYDQTPETLQARVGTALLFAIETAMRAGEICNLQWEFVDFERRLAHLPITKNGHSRDVPLSKEALRLLQQLKPLSSTHSGCESVFHLSSASLDALFRKAKARTLIVDLHFHDSRREALTRLARKVDVMTLAKISGHRDLRILQNVYYAPDMGDVADLLD